MKMITLESAWDLLNDCTAVVMELMPFAIIYASLM